MFESYPKNRHQKKVNSIKNELNLVQLKVERDRIQVAQPSQRKCQHCRDSNSRIQSGSSPRDRFNTSERLDRQKSVANRTSKKYITITLTLLHPRQLIPIQNWRFEKALNVWIGRASNNHVVLRSCVVSRHHVELRQLEGKWILTSFGCNGTYMNDEKISTICVENGTILHLARTGPVIQIHLTDSNMTKEPLNAEHQDVSGSVGQSIGHTRTLTNVPEKHIMSR